MQTGSTDFRVDRECNNECGLSPAQQCRWQRPRDTQEQGPCSRGQGRWAPPQLSSDVSLR